MDYVTIELNDTPNMIKLKYGSGLNKTIPTRSPLFRGFSGALAGDDGIDQSIDEDS